MLYFYKNIIFLLLLNKIIFIKIFINSLNKIAKEIQYIWDKYKVEKIVVPWNDKIEELYGKIYQASNFQE